MTIEVTRVPNAGAESPEDLVVVIQAIGKLEKADFERLGARLELLVEQHGKLDMLVELVDFDGWTVDAAWEDVKFALDHFSDIERIAVVGESHWERALAILAKPFTAAAVRYFDIEDRDSAVAWIEQRQNAEIS